MFEVCDVARCGYLLGLVSRLGYKGGANTGLDYSGSSFCRDEYSLVRLPRFVFELDYDGE